MQCSAMREANPGASGKAGAHRRCDGLKPNRPLSAAGSRKDPPASFPWAIGTIPAATNAADPPDEPPADSPSRHGLSVGPCSADSVLPRRPNSELAVEQMTFSPLPAIRAAYGEIAGAGLASISRDPIVHGSPGQASSSLTANGTPVSAPAV